MKIFKNSIRTPDGTILTSTHVHDFVQHTDLNGEDYFLDGGEYYIKTSVNKIPAKDLSVTSDSPHEDIRNYFTWKSYGKPATLPMRRVLLKDLTNEHIEAIIVTQLHLTTEVLCLFGDELIYRDNFDLNIYEGEI